MRDIGKNIRAIRISKQMTQDALADALFVTRQTVSNYENGRSRPDVDMLLKIADVFNTDVNSVIYGPVVPKSKKITYRLLVISSFLLLLTGAAYLVIYTFLSGIETYLYSAEHFSARLLNNLAILPAVMCIGGWLLMHILSIFCNLRQLQAKWAKAVRITLFTIVGIWTATITPYIIFLLAVLIRALSTTSLSMTFPYIPVYQEVSTVMIKLTLDVPFIFAIFGGSFWISGIPNINNNADR